MPIPNNEKPSALNIERNPFYILNVSCVDDRRKIISAAEEMSFLSDADICTEAQNILLTPSKRLSAELDWFIETDISLVDEIKICLKSNKPITIENLNALSKLNAILYNFCISKETDSFSLGFEILEIDKQFGKLNSSFLTEIINNCRRMAKMTEATESDVSIELSKKRERIRSIVSSKLQLLKESDYIELVTLFAEKYIDNEKYNDSGIISDIIDQYEIWVKSIMGSKEDEIRKCIDSIKALDNDSKTKQAVANLISLIKEWDMYAQPLQVNLASKGIEDRISRDIAIDIRDLAIYLHNEKGKTSQALEIVEALKVYFAELSEVLKVVSEDAETLKRLNRLKNEKEGFENKKGQNKRADKTYSVRVSHEKIVIPPFCTCCMQPTENKEHISCSKTNQNGNTNTIGIDLPVCKECLSHRKKFIGYLVLICSLAILAGIISMLIFVQQGIDIFGGGLISGGIATGIYYILSYLLKTKELLEKHTARGVSVSISSPFLAFSSNPPFILTFANREYCQLFALSNNMTVDDITETESIKTNTSKSTRVLYANGKNTLTVVIMLVVFVVIAFIIGSIMSESGNTLDYSSSSYASGSASSSSSFNSTSPSSEESVFSQNLRAGTEAYASIVSIKPAIGIRYHNNTFNSDVVCECETSDNKKIWVYMSVDEYNRCIDSNASIIFSNLADFEPKAYSPYKIIHGVAQEANSLVHGLSQETDDIILGFVSIE